MLKSFICTLKVLFYIFRYGIYGADDRINAELAAARARNKALTQILYQIQQKGKGGRRIR